MVPIVLQIVILGDGSSIGIEQVTRGGVLHTCAKWLLYYMVGILLYHKWLIKNDSGGFPF